MQLLDGLVGHESQRDVDDTNHYTEDTHQCSIVCNEFMARDIRRNPGTDDQEVDPNSFRFKYRFLFYWHQISFMS